MIRTIQVLIGDKSVCRSSCGQTGEDNVVNVRSGKAVGAGVVLEGGDYPLLGLDRRESGQAGALHELKDCVVR
jgi:hypothetical protein